MSDITIAPFPRRAPPVKSFVAVPNKSLVQVVVRAPHTHTHFAPAPPHHTLARHAPYTQTPRNESRTVRPGRRRASGVMGTAGWRPQQLSRRARRTRSGPAGRPEGMAQRRLRRPPHRRGRTRRRAGRAARAPPAPSRGRRGRSACARPGARTRRPGRRRYTDMYTDCAAVAEVAPASRQKRAAAASAVSRSSSRTSALVSAKAPMTSPRTRG